jgi:hypothetical protein
MQIHNLRPWKPPHTDFLIFIEIEWTLIFAAVAKLGSPFCFWKILKKRNVRTYGEYCWTTICLSNFFFRFWVKLWHDTHRLLYMYNCPNNTRLVTTHTRNDKLWLYVWRYVSLWILYQHYKVSSGSRMKSHPNMEYFRGLTGVNSSP